MLTSVSLKNKSLTDEDSMHLTGVSAGLMKVCEKRAVVVTSKEGSKLM